MSSQYEKDLDTLVRYARERIQHQTPAAQAFTTPPQGMVQQKDRVWVIGTRAILEEFRSRIARLNDAAYDLDEIGSLLVNHIHQHETGPEEYARLRSEFAEHFAAQHKGDLDGFNYAYETYDQLFDAIQGELFRARAEDIGGTDFYCLTFHSWMADDLVVIQRRTPY